MNKEMLRKFLEEVIKSFRYEGSYKIILIMYIICKRERENRSGVGRGPRKYKHGILGRERFGLK